MASFGYGPVLVVMPFGYDALHPGARGTLTLLIDALPGAHYDLIRGLRQLPLTSFLYREALLLFSSSILSDASSSRLARDRFQSPGRLLATCLHAVVLRCGTQAWHQRVTTVGTWGVERPHTPHPTRLGTA